VGGGVGSGECRVESVKWEWKVESGKWSGEWIIWRVEKLVIEIIKAVVRCNLIAIGNHVSPLALVTEEICVS
jgi:hypothetical protein